MTSVEPGIWVRERAAALALVIFAASHVSAGPAAFASPVQAAAAAPAAGSRVAGTVTAVSGNVLTVKQDTGTEAKVTIPDSARILQLAAGSKNLSAATAIKLPEIAVGDRILAKTTVDGDSFTASTVLAMKQSEIAQLQQRERDEWQTKGINGLVKSVDSATQNVVISTGSGATAKMVTVQASKGAVIRRYAPDSTKFDDAKPATLDLIKPGDQLRAKGEKSADGMEFAADAIVAGTFRNIAGTVVSVDPSANNVTVTDLATKKPFVISINADSQLHKLPPAMAQGIAMRLKGGTTATGTAAGQSGAPPVHSPGAGDAQGPPRMAPSSPPPSGGAALPEGAGATTRQRAGDIQQVLNRAPVLALAELKKGDAVMVLTTEGQAPGEATAVTMLAGVEPLLQASPNASQSVLSASWNLGGGAAAGQDAQ